ncbi:MAG: Smr/MutS family protein [Bacteroidota bacterium]
MKRKNNFQVGDKVAMLNETIKGIVTKIDLNKVIIKSEDGFEYECYENELITVGNLDSYLKNDHHFEFLKEIDQQKRKKDPKIKQTKRNQIPPLEVDLHIHQLVNSTKGLTNYDILSLQLRTAKQQLEFAIQKKIPRVVFIHGVGEGVLKQELEYLFKKYAVETYEASFQKYGQGATEVYIYQNTKK